MIYANNGFALSVESNILAGSKKTIKKNKPCDVVYGVWTSKSTILQKKKINK